MWVVMVAALLAVMLVALAALLADVPVRRLAGRALLRVGRWLLAEGDGDVLLDVGQGSGPAVQRAKSRRWATTVWLN